MPEQQVAVTFKDLLPLIGVAIGLAWGFVNNLYWDRRRRAADRKNLAQAFAGEISALQRIIEIRQYIKYVNVAMEYMRSTNQPYPLIAPVQRQYFNVYEKNVSQIGILEGPLPSMIATFYTQGNAILEDLNAYRDFPYDNITNVTSLIERYERLLEIFTNTKELGESILKEIERRYS